MSEEFFMGVPPRALRAALSQKPDEPYSEDAAIMSLMLDIDINNVKPVRAYARIWNWGHKRVRLNLDSMIETAREWLAWNGQKGAQQGHSRGTAGAQKQNVSPIKQIGRGTAGAQQGHSRGTQLDSTTEEDIRTTSSSLSKWGSVFKEIEESWNAFASRNGLPTIRGLNSKREAAIRQRYAKHSKDLPEVYRRIADSPWCKGDNPRGWKADFDWLWCKSDTFDRIMEGTSAKPASGLPGEKVVHIGSLRQMTADEQRLQKVFNQ